MSQESLRTSRLLSHLTSTLRKSRPQQSPRQLRLEPLDARRVLAVVIGDFNGDGYGDMASGIPGEDVGTLADAGAVSVIYGTNLGLQATGDQLWHQDIANVEGVAEAGDRFGESLAVGDFNNDGYDDLAIGAPGEAVDAISEAGAVNVLYGSASGLTVANDQIFHQDVAGVLEVAEAYDRFGATLITGDFNGDGYDDLAIGVAQENIADRQDAGMVQVLYGSVVRLRTSGNKTFAEGTGGISGDSGRYDLFGAALAAGDFNGDGYDDLAIGAPGDNVGAVHDVGAVSILYGTASGLGSANNVQYTQNSTNVPDAGEAWDNFGATLAAGDFDNDGYDDLAIGTPNEDVLTAVDAGSVHVMYGRNTYQFDSTRHEQWTQNSFGITGASESRDYFGASLAVGNFNHGGQDDLAIGVPGENTALTDTGAVNIIYGAGSGLSSSGNVLYTQDSTGVEGVEEVFDFFGSDVAAGDTNGDGYEDLAVAVAGEAIGAISDAGAVQVFRGQSTAGPGTTGLRTDNDFIWHQDVTGIEYLAEANDFFGGKQPEAMLGGSVPALQSNPGATKHLFLDFDGGYSSGIYTEAFDLDDQSGFHRTERSVIADVWAYVSEDFAPFNINVTTVLPTSGEVFRVLIGDDGTERQDDPTSVGAGRLHRCQRQQQRRLRLLQADSRLVRRRRQSGAAVRHHGLA